jgi:CheY-like chemotaxis protein
VISTSFWVWSAVTAEPERLGQTNGPARFDDPQSSGELVTVDLDAPAMGKRPLVMVIDDDEDIRTAIQDLLDSEGFATVGAADGQAALNLLADLADRPAVILLDLMMPIVDGWTFCKVRQGILTLMEIPVITISAASSAGTSAPLRVEGSIKKPFDADALIELVTRMVGRKGLVGRPPVLAPE